MNNIFKDSFDKTIESMGGYQGSSLGSEYVSDVQNAIDQTIEQIKIIGSTDKGIHYIKGDIAEPWHAGTLKIYSAAKGIDNLKANVPRDSSPIDITAQSPNEFLRAQVKYFKTPEDTAKAISKLKYHGLEKIVPEDQLEGIKAAALRLHQKNLNTRPELAQEYLDTYNRVADRIKIAKAQSVPLSEKEALRIAKELQKDHFSPDQYGLNTLNFIEWSDIIRESGEAALNTTILTAVLKSSPHLWNIMKEFVQEGQVSRDKIEKLGLAAASGSVEGALRGGIAATVTASCKSGLLGESLRLVNPTVVAAATVVAMNAVHNAIGVYQGKLTKEQFAESCIRDTFVVGMGIWGATIGQTLIPVPLLGVVIGNFIGSTCATFIYEGSKQLFLSFFIKSGVSFLNIVNQDYTLPREVLEQCGFDLIQLDEIELDTIEWDTIELDTIELDILDIKVLKRGLIAVNTIGYIY